MGRAFAVGEPLMGGLIKARRVRTRALYLDVWASGGVGHPMHNRGIRRERAWVPKRTSQIKPKRREAASR